MKNQAFTTSFGLRNRHVQTLFSSFFRKIKTPQAEIEVFELEDGDFVECYWLEKPKNRDAKAIVILFHGLAGSFHSPYIQGVMNALQEEKIPSVVMHFRGCSGKSNRFAKSYHSGETLDAKAWIHHVHTTFPQAKLFAVGYSLGANMLLKLLGEEGERALLSGAICVSAPMQLEVSATQMDRGFAKFYQYILLRDLKRSLLQKYEHHDIKSLIGLEKNEVKKLRNFWEFDAAYTAPIHGFGSAQEYYEKSSAKQYLIHIRIPTLIIHALDDPFMSEKILPTREELSPNITLQVSKNGGHVGFIAGNLREPQYWLEEKILEYFKSFIE